LKPAISLAAWITASMSALSKLSTICRPVLAGGVIGRAGAGVAWAVVARPGGGAAGAAGAAGAGTTATVPASGEGWPGGRAGGSSGAVTVTVGGPETGGAGVVVAPGPAHPPRTARPTIAMRRRASVSIIPPRSAPVPLCLAAAVGVARAAVAGLEP
jgi:hypothetical protein